LAAKVTSDSEREFQEGGREGQGVEWGRGSTGGWSVYSPSALAVRCVIVGGWNPLRSFDGTHESCLDTKPMLVAWARTGS
jgi:hypothetical protein